MKRSIHKPSSRSAFIPFQSKREKNNILPNTHVTTGIEPLPYTNTTYSIPNPLIPINTLYPHSPHLNVNEQQNFFSYKFPLIHASNEIKSQNNINQNNPHKYIPTVNQKFQPKNYLIHYQNESVLKKYECLICLKRFRTLSTATTHLRVHTGERPYACSLCDKRFAQLSTLTRHGRVHKKQKDSNRVNGSKEEKVEEKS